MTRPTYGTCDGCGAVGPLVRVCEADDGAVCAYGPCCSTTPDDVLAAALLAPERFRVIVGPYGAVMVALR